MLYDKYSADGRVGFIESTHEYLLVNNPELRFKSCTGFLKQFEPQFEADKAAKSYLKKNGIPGTPENVKKLQAGWKETNDQANIKGTAVHQFGEIFMLDDSYTIPNLLPEMEALKAFKKDYIGTMWKVHTLEILLYNEDLMLAGQSDLKLSSIADPTKIIYGDYKTNKEFTFTNDYGKMMLGQFQDFPYCKFVSYSIQLSIYRFLDHIDSSNVEAAYIIYLKNDGTYELIKALDIRFIFYNNEFILLNKDEVLDQYRQELSNRGINTTNLSKPMDNKIINLSYLK